MPTDARRPAIVLEAAHCPSRVKFPDHLAFKADYASPHSFVAPAVSLDCFRLLCKTDFNVP